MENFALKAATTAAGTLSAEIFCAIAEETKTVVAKNYTSFFIFRRLNKVCTKI